MGTTEDLDIDIGELQPEMVRDKPFLPHPAWATAFVAAAIFDLWWGLWYLSREVIGEVSPELAFALEKDFALGILLGAAVVTVYHLVMNRTFDEEAYLAATCRGLRIRFRDVGGVLFAGTLYVLSYLPVIYEGPEGLAGGALAGFPLNVGMCYIMWDLRRLHRAAWRIIRQVKSRGEVKQEA